VTRRTAWLFLVTRPNGTAEQAIFYAPSKADAVKYAEAWAWRMGFEVEVEKEALVRRRISLVSPGSNGRRAPRREIAEINEIRDRAHRRAAEARSDLRGDRGRPCSATSTPRARDPQGKAGRQRDEQVRWDDRHLLAVSQEACVERSPQSDFDKRPGAERWDPSSPAPCTPRQMRISPASPRSPDLEKPALRRKAGRRDEL
jgi:hypothetical protein